MREPRNTATATATLYFGDIRLQLKARRDDSDANPSGWSIIAFTYSAPIRCVRAHQPKHLELFINSIVALCNTSQWNASSQIEKAFHDITEGSFSKTYKQV